MAQRNSSGLSLEEGRRFGISLGSAFLAIGAFVLWRGHLWLAYIMAPVGLLLLASAVLAPGRLGPVSRTWMKLAEFISRFTTPIFLGIVYLFVITPTGLLVRAFGHNPIRKDPETDSYWTRNDTEKWSDLYRQF